MRRQPACLALRFAAGAVTVGVGRRPWNTVLAPDGGKWYVANRRSGGVPVFDTVSFAKLRDIEAGELPRGVSIR